MDILCVVCGEPWDCYGINHGDMNKWEADLFKKGAGCPSCEGEADEPWEPKTIFDIENGDGDPIERLHAWETAQTTAKPEWRRPDPKILWSCVACGVNAVESPDDGALEYDLPFGAAARQWYNSHPFHRSEPEAEPAHIFVGTGYDSYGEITDKLSVCEYCLNHCDNCGEPVCGMLSDDPYGPGYCSTLHNYGYNYVYCIDCIESTCALCDSFPDDCDCCGDCDSTKDDCTCEVTADDCDCCGDCDSTKDDCTCEVTADE